MSTSRSVVLLLACCVGVSAQIPKLLVEDGTSETLALGKVTDAADPASKVAAAEAYLQKYPKSDAKLYLADQLQNAYLETKQYDKAMDAAKQLLAVLPGHVASGMAGLKAAEGKKDGKQILEWAARASQACRTALQAQHPSLTETNEELAERQQFAKQVSQYAEYAVYSMTTQPAYGKDKAAILAVMQQQWPDSKYLNASPASTASIRANSSNSDEAVVIAEKMIHDGKATGDALLLATSYYFQKRSDKTLLYGQKLIDYANTNDPSPDDVADWSHKRRFALVNAYYMVGMTFSEVERYAQADKYLRQAVSLLKDDPGKLATVLFHLGFANYKLAEATPDKARISDAIRFTEQCVNMKSPFQAAAAKNLDAFKAQFNIP